MGDAAGRAVGQVGQTTNQAVGRVSDQAGRLLEETVNEAGQRVQRVVDESGSIVERILDESGEVVDEAVVGNASDLTSEEEHTADLGEHSESSVPDEEELNATSAARQKAEELGVDLSQIAGSGVGGLITVSDVIQAARG